MPRLLEKVIEIQLNLAQRAYFTLISENFASLAKAGRRSWILVCRGQYKNQYPTADA